MTDYPYEDGDVIVLGPECFVAKDKNVLCWKGQNYVPQPPPASADDNGVNWYVLGFDGERGDRIVKALDAMGMVREAAYVQTAAHVPAAEAAPYLPIGMKGKRDA